MLNEAIQVIPVYFALDAAFRRRDPEAMRRWICCWAATVCFLIIFDYIEQGLLIKSVMIYQLARQDADWASMIVSRMVSDPLLVPFKVIAGVMNIILLLNEQCRYGSTRRPAICRPSFSTIWSYSSVPTIDGCNIIPPMLSTKDPRLSTRQIN